MKLRPQGVMVYAVADQAVSSATNFLAFGLFVRRANASESGEYAVLLSLLLLGQLLGRQAILVPAVTRQRVLDRSHVRSLWRHNWRGLASTGGLVAVGIAVVGVVTDLGKLVPTFVALAIPIVVFEGYRFLLLAARMTRRALLLDVVWLGVLVLTIPVTASGLVSASPVLALWGTGASIALLVGLVTGARRDLDESVDPVAPNMRDRATLIMEALVERGSLSVSLLVVSGALGVAEVGRLEVARQAFAPINVVILGLLPVLFGSLVHHRDSGGSALKRVAPFLGLIGAMTVGWTILLASPIGNAGGRLFGPLWESASSLILPVGVGIAGIALQSMARIIMHARAKYVASLVARCLAAGSLLATAVYVAATDGSVGVLFSWGLVIGACLSGLIAVVTLRQASLPSNRT